jgi:hypothetical protein
MSSSTDAPTSSDDALSSSDDAQTQDTMMAMP